MKFIFIILTLLLASLYVHSEDIDSVDGDYCLVLETMPRLLLVKKYKNVVIRTVEKESIWCKSPYIQDYIVFGEKIEFIDTSGRSIVLIGGFHALTPGVRYDYPNETNRGNSNLLPREIQQIDLPRGLSSRAFEMSPKEKNRMLKDLLQFKDKVVDGDIEVLLYGCKPHELKYNVKFRARIVGECECDFLNKRER